MAGFIALAVSDTYIGTYTASEEVENGNFVELDHKEKTGALAGASATEVYFIYNENTNIPEYGIDDIDFKVKKGEFLRAHRPQAGEILVTTCIEGDLVEGDSVDIVDGGKVGKVEGGRFVVKELTNEFSVPTVRLLVVDVNKATPTP